MTLLRRDASAKVFTIRQGLKVDAASISRIAYRSIRISEERACMECLRILEEPFAFSVVAEHSLPGASSEIVGVLNASLIKPWFLKRLLESKEPFLHNKIRSASASPFPSEEEVAIANGTNGLDLLVTHFSLAASLSSDQALWIRSELVSAFVSWFSGNRLRSVVLEAIGSGNTFQAMEGGFEVVTTYKDWRQAKAIPEEDGPTLLRIALPKVSNTHNYQLVRLLHYTPPIFSFSRGARKILRLASYGLGDYSIRQSLGKTERAMNSAWSRIYRSVDEVWPGLIPTGASGARLRKRESVLEYVRAHPEERWPYKNTLSSSDD